MRKARLSHKNRKEAHDARPLLNARNFKELYQTQAFDFLTKTELSRLSGCDRNSLMDYEKKLAMRLPDYLKLMRKDHRGVPIRGRPLAPYQSWVLLCIRELFRRKFTTEDIKQLCKEPQNKAKLSYEAFVKGDYDEN